MLNKIHSRQAEARYVSLTQVLAGPLNCNCQLLCDLQSLMLCRNAFKCLRVFYKTFEICESNYKGNNFTVGEFPFISFTEDQQSNKQGFLSPN